MADMTNLILAEQAKQLAITLHNRHIQDLKKNGLTKEEESVLFAERILPEMVEFAIQHRIKRGYNITENEKKEIEKKNVAIHEEVLKPYNDLTWIYMEQHRNCEETLPEQVVDLIDRHIDEKGKQGVELSKRGKNIERIWGICYGENK